MALNYIKVLILLQHILLQLCLQAKFQSPRAFYPFAYPFESYSVAGTHIVVSRSSPPEINFFDFSTSQSMLKSLYFDSTNIRILSIGTNKFNNYCIRLIDNNFTFRTLEFNTTCTNIVYQTFPDILHLNTWGYATNESEIYFTYQSTYNQQLTIVWIRNGNLNIYLDPNLYRNDKSKFHNCTYFYLASEKLNLYAKSIFIFQDQPNRQPILLTKLILPMCVTSDFDVFDQYFIVLCGNMSIIFNSYPPFIPFYALNLSQPSVKVSIIGNTFVLLKSQGKLEQRRLDNGNLMDTYQADSNLNLMEKIGNSSLYLFNQSTGILFNISSTIICFSICNCPLNFIDTGLQCIQYIHYNQVNSTNQTSSNISNINNTFGNNQTNITYNTSNISTNLSSNNFSANISSILNTTTASNYTNISNFNGSNLFNSTVYNNSTNISNQLNITLNNLTNVSAGEIVTNNSVYHDIPPAVLNKINQNIRNASFLIGNTFSLASLCFNLKSNFPLSWLMQQIWLYKYYKNISYPEIMNVMMQQVEIINYLKLSPNFTNFINFNFSVGREDAFSKIYQDSTISYPYIYLGKSFKQYCIVGLWLSVIFFIFFLTLDYCCKAIRRNSSNQEYCLVKKVRLSIQERSRARQLFLSLILGDYHLLSYLCLNQMSLFYFYSLENKLNILFCAIVFFILFVFANIGFLLCYHLFGKKSKQLLTFSWDKRIWIAMWFENWFTFGIKMMKNFVHSSVVEQSKRKFLFLFMIDLIAIGLIVINKRLFISKLNLLVYLLYQLLFGMVNLLLAFHQSEIIFFTSFQFQNVVDYCVIIGVCSGLIKFLIVLLSPLYKFIAKIRKQISSIQPESLNKLQQARQSKQFQQKKDQIKKITIEQLNYQGQVDFQKKKGITCQIKKVKKQKISIGQNTLNINLKIGRQKHNE